MKKLKIKWSNIIDLLIFTYSICVLVHDTKMFIDGWMITWIGIIELISVMVLLDILFIEHKKVLKDAIGKALRVLGVNNIFTTKLYHETNKNAKGGF